MSNVKKKKRWREINKNIWYFPDSWAFPGGSDGKNLPAMQET